MRWLGLLLLLAGFGCQGPPGDTDVPGAPSADTRSRTGRVVSGDGDSIAYSVEGDGQPALLFVHGWAGERGYWRVQVDDLAADHRVATLDLPGHGESTRNRAEWTIQGFAEDVRVLTEELGLDDLVLIGHSMGGAVVLEAAGLMPDRVVGVIGVDTLHDAEYQLDQAWLVENQRQLEQDFVATCERLVRSWFHEASDAELIEEVVADICSAPPEVATPLMQLYPEYDLAAGLGKVAVPIRCINSRLLATNLQANRRYAPSFDAVIMDGVGHFPMLEKPEEFNLLLRRMILEITGTARP
jgi:pimeloyl-ACP methyl ester carboxylesterase